MLVMTSNQLRTRILVAYEDAFSKSGATELTLDEFTRIRIYIERELLHVQRIIEDQTRERPADKG